MKITCGVYLGLLATVTSLSACGFPDGANVTGGCFLACSMGPAIQYALQPTSARLLTGDTLSIKSYSCPAASFICAPLPGVPGNVSSAWSAGGDTIAIRLADGAQISSVASASTILVKGFATGQIVLNATRVGTSAQLNALITVHDSSEVAAVDITGVATDTIRVPTELPYPARLRGGGYEFRAVPTSWATSDTSIAVVSRIELSEGLATAWVKGKKAGAVQLRAHFLGLVGTKNLTVIP